MFRDTRYISPVSRGIKRWCSDAFHMLLGLRYNFFTLGLYYIPTLARLTEVSSIALQNI